MLVYSVQPTNQLTNQQNESTMKVIKHEWGKVLRINLKTIYQEWAIKNLFNLFCRCSCDAIAIPNDAMEKLLCAHKIRCIFVK